MQIVERREHEGAWWGCSPDGSWFRWSTSTVGWEGPLTPPWPGPAPDEGSVVAPAMASAAPEALPMSRIDAWWNRNFPPFSRRRLVFGLVALPVIGGLQELLWMAVGRGASLPRYLFVCVAGGALLATAWMPGMRGLAEALQRSRSAGRDADVPAPPLPPTRETFRRDFRVAVPFAFVVVLILHLTAAGARETFTGPSLVSVAIESAAVAAMVALRSSIWGLVLFSVAGGLLGGFAVVLLGLMTFSDTGWVEFAGGWVIGSILLLAYAYPVWRGLRNMEARGFRLPMWVVMGGSVVLVSGAALMFVFER